MRWFASFSARQLSLLILIGAFACLGAAWNAAAIAPLAHAGSGGSGDVDCDSDVDSVDGLKVLRHTAGLPNDQPDGCPAIGSAPNARLAGQGKGATTGPGSMTAMSIDMALFGNSPNSVLSIQPCARLDANGRQDAEETAVDTLTFDITAQGIPGEYPMLGFNAYVSYDPAHFQVTGSDTSQMLAADPGSLIFDGSEPVPDTDGGFTAGALDTAPRGSEESGSGVLARITITANKGAPSGEYDVSLTDAAHIDATNEAWLPNAVNSGMIAVNQPCPVEVAHGDVDCDGDVDSVDALRILRDVAALPNELPGGCPPIS